MTHGPPTLDPEAAVIAVLSYPDPGAAADWLVEAFGFAIRLRIFNHRIQLDVRWRGARHDRLAVGGRGRRGRRPLDAHPGRRRGRGLRASPGGRRDRRHAAAGLRLRRAPGQPGGPVGPPLDVLQTIADVDPADWADNSRTPPEVDAPPRRAREVSGRGPARRIRGSRVRRAMAGRGQDRRRVGELLDRVAVQVLEVEPERVAPGALGATGTVRARPRPASRAIAASRSRPSASAPGSPGPRESPPGRGPCRSSRTMSGCRCRAGRASSTRRRARGRAWRGGRAASEATRRRMGHPTCPRPAGSGREPSRGGRTVDRCPRASLGQCAAIPVEL